MEFAGVLDPGLGGELDGIPGAAEGWGVAQVQVVEAIHGHAVEQRVRWGVDAFGDLGVVVADQLGTKQPPRHSVPGDSDVELVGARVIGLVVELGRADRQGVKPGRGCFLIAQASAGHRQFEYLDDLGAQRPSELPIPTDGRLAGHPALLVGGRAKRQVGGLAEKPMPGSTQSPAASTSGRLVRIRRSTCSAPRTPVWTPAATANSVSGRTPTTTRTRSAVTAKSGSPATTRPPFSRRMALTATSLTTWTSWRRSSWPNTRPSSMSTVGMTAGACSISVTARPRAQNASAISRPM